MPASSLDQVVSLCKRRGFIFPGSEIYGGLANTWDYGPLGVELKNKLKRLWWKNFVHKRSDMVGLDASILMNPKVWEASGHVGSFTDPLMDCKNCNHRIRADKVVEDRLGNGLAYPSIVKIILEISQEEPPEKAQPWHKFWKMRKDPQYAMSILPFLVSEDPKRLAEYVNQKTGRIALVPKESGSYICPSCGKCDWTPPRQFNLMFRTQQGVIEGEGQDIYLRPETAQGIFVNFKNVLDTMRLRLPFGVAQIGKAFRNEITPGNFTFRTREFEQMEIEYFFDPERQKWEDVYAQWKKSSREFLTKTLGIRDENLRFRDHEKDELSHYSKGTVDIEYKFPWGWGELCAAAAYRTDYDLLQHQKFSGQELMYTDPDEPTRKITPHVMEPSFGSDRIALAVLLDAYTEEAVTDDTRTVMKFTRKLAPIDVAILPLSKKEHLVAKAKDIHQMILNKTELVTDFDVTGSIGKRYRRQDEIGTPLCITVDFGTLGEDEKQGAKDTVTIRDRDTLEQRRVSIDQLIQEVQS